MLPPIAIERRARLSDAVVQAEFDVFIAATIANVLYATGFASPIGNMNGWHPMVAVVTPSDSRLVIPVADSAPAIEIGVPADEIVAYGRFYFESPHGALPSLLADRLASLGEAVGEALGSLGVTSGTVGVDLDGLGRLTSSVLEALPPRIRVVDASEWARGVRARKTPGEIELLERSAVLAVSAIDEAISATVVGMTENEIASVVAGAMVRGGGMPKFAVVTTGARSALADALNTDRAVRPGDLVRFDVGCVIDGYWSDIGRTAVVGVPDEVQSQRYEAILAGEDAQIEALRPGAVGGEIFSVAMQTVKDRGIAGYRRQHCGHGIGAEMYESPSITNGSADRMQAGMVLCLETPFYELGWGGMMVEDTVLVTETGCRSFTDTDRSLKVIEA